MAISPAVVAHRGSRYFWPENTMVAFEGAVATGVTHIETDLRVTADGVVVCHHDRTVDRTTDGSGPVDAMTFDELDRLDAGYRHRGDEGFPHRGSGVRVPALEELRSEEHTSELQSRPHLVCRLLLEKKKPT